METQNAIQLIKELKMNRLLPKYNEELIREVAVDINNQFQSINDSICDPDLNKESVSDTAHLNLTCQCMNRNIRCTLAYLNMRLSKIERFAWESGKHLPEHLLNQMSSSEI